MEKEIDSQLYNADEALKLKNQLCFPLYAASRRIVNAYQPFLSPLGLTYTQYLVFLVLWEEDGLGVSEICERLKLDNGTITPLLKKLESEGYLKRSRSECDERKVVVTLTDRGRALRNEAKEIPRKVGSCFSLSPEDAAALYMLLYKVLG